VVVGGGDMERVGRDRGEGELRARMIAGGGGRGGRAWRGQVGPCNAAPMLELLLELYHMVHTRPLIKPPPTPQIISTAHLWSPSAPPPLGPQIRVWMGCDLSWFGMDARQPG